MNLLHNGDHDTLISLDFCCVDDGLCNRISRTFPLAINRCMCVCVCNCDVTVEVLIGSCCAVVRFLIGPIFVIIALSVWPKYMRAKIVNGVDNSITFLAQAFLLVSRATFY